MTELGNPRDPLPGADVRTRGTTPMVGRRYGLGWGWGVGIFVLLMLLAIEGWGWGGWYGRPVGTTPSGMSPSGTAATNPASTAQRTP